MKTFRTLFVMASLALPAVAFASPKPAATKPVSTATPTATTTTKAQPKAHKHHAAKKTATPPATK
jgi:hypothetical protein